MYYNEKALIRDKENANVLLTLLESLTSFSFDFVIQDKNLEDPDYWSRLISRRFIFFT